MRFILLSLLFFAFPAHASVSVPFRIDGTDSLCTGYTPSVSGGTSVLTCNQAPPTPGAPTNCVATVNGTTAANFTSAGGTASLSVTCDQTAITYNWSRNSIFGANTNRQWSDVLPSNGGGTPVNYLYQVRACNGSSCVTVPTSALTATVAASGSFSGSCPGFDTTIILTLNWASPVRVFTGHMGPNDMVLVQFTTGNVPTTTSLVTVSGAEWNSPPSSRVATLTTTPCNFSTQSPPGANIGPSTSVTSKFAITPGTGYSYYPILNTNTTYYLNVKNVVSPTCAAGVGECGMFFDLLKPGGL